MGLGVGVGVGLGVGVGVGVEKQPGDLHIYALTPYGCFIEGIVVRVHCHPFDLKYVSCSVQYANILAV